MISAGMSLEEIVEARASFAGFFRNVAASSKGAFTSNGITRLWDAMLPWMFSQKGRLHFSVVGPAGLYKSEKTRYFTTYALGCDPTLRVVYTSRDLDVSIASVSTCRKIVGSHRFQAVFPEVVPDRVRSKPKGDKEDPMGWQQGRFFLVHKGTFDPHPAMEAVAADPEAQNRRVDLLIADDFETKYTARSPLIRSQVYSTFMETWLRGRLMSGDTQGQAIALQNCWHKDDLAHKLRKDERFVSMWFGVNASLDSLFVRLYNAPENCPVVRNPAALGATRVPSEDGASHQFDMPFPDGSNRFSLDAMNAEKRTNVFFSSTYRLVASDNTDRMVPQWTNRKFHAGRVHDMLRVPTQKERPLLSASMASNYAFAWGMDMASARRKKPGDCLVCLSLDSLGVIRPMEVHYGSFNAAQVVGIINDAYLRGINPSVVRVENNATQDKFLTEVKIIAREPSSACPWSSRIEAHSTGQNKHDAAMGLPAINLEIESGKLEWPEGEAMPGAPFRNDWARLGNDIEECPRFPLPNETPDGIMAFWFAWKGLQDRAMIASRQKPVESVPQARTRIDF